MILAVSRFRVANGTAEAVAGAFLDRPRLVDSWPGFLGLEVFRDTEDASLFYLVTRWTSVAAFREWHRSPAHRASHEWMPKGLRLDASFTKLVELERLSRGVDHDPYNLVIDGAAGIAQYFERSAVVHVLRLARDGTIRFANDAGAALLGAPARELAGTPVFTRLTEPDAARLRAILADGPVPDGPLLLNFCGDADGDPTTLACHLHLTPTDCLILAEPAYESDRTFREQLIALNQDLAALARQRHRAVAAEQAARRTAELATRTKDEALAVIAHELRQPLNAATMAIAVLEQRPDALERFHGVLKRQLAHMTRLVDDLLDASNVMRGTIQLQKQRVDLRSVVQEGFDLLEPQILQRQQQPSLALAPEAVDITADPTRVRQVFSNVLTNASKYTPDGGMIMVHVERDNEFGIIRVRDSGKGMTPEALERVFDLFVRASADPAGLGIGLAVSKRLVELHGGSIEGRSEGPGRGSEFVVRWPLAE